VQVMLDKVLTSRELSFPMRAALFSAFNLEMLATVLRSSDPSVLARGASGVDKAAPDPKLAGALRDKVCRVLQTFTCEVLSSSTERAGAANVKLLLPLVTTLRPSDDVLQQQLLISILKKHPPLQGHYLLASPLPLMPAASHKFLTSAAVMAKTLALIPGSDADSSLLHQLHILPPHQEHTYLQQISAGFLAGGITAIPAPPTHTTILADWVAPPLLCKGSLSPGLQHASYLVRLATAQMLLLILARLDSAVGALCGVSAVLSSATAHGAGNEVFACNTGTLLLIHQYINVYKCTHVHVYIYIYICIYIYIHIHVYACFHRYMDTHVFVYASQCIHVI